jgi:acyl-CoA synthetase (AMP-forming)/AMP-acid ligase II
LHKTGIAAVATGKGLSLKEVTNTTHGYPFDRTGIFRGADGIARYQDRPDSLVQMLRNSVDNAPESEAIVETGGERITFRDLWERSARVAGGLHDLGIQAGDRVAIRLGNSLNWCLAFFGAQLAGAIAVPVNTRFTEAEASYVIEDSGSKFIFSPAEPLPQGNAYVYEQAAPDDVAAIFYTSGTTGFPKGAMTTHANFLANVENCRRATQVPFDGSLRTLISVPLFHVTACNSQLLLAIEGMHATVIMPEFNIQKFLEILEAERINALTSVPAVYWYAINQPNFKNIDVSRVRKLSYGGAPIAPDLVARILESFPNARVGNGFGLTETSSLATYLPHEYARLRPETVGFGAPVVDLKLDGASAENDIGELLIRGPNVVKGYWNKPEATRETFVDGWLHTGDLARLDKDGFVQIVDRKKDMVNRGGENVYCIEVENALAAHPAVFEAAVLGVPDEMMGEKVGAVIVLKPGQRATGAEIAEHVRTRLANFKVPQFIVLREELLPRNPNGKVLKKRIREAVSWGNPVW